MTCRRTAAHPFYTRLNHIFDEHHFDEYVEALCQRFYADDGRPGLAPGRYFRLLLIGYFVEGLDAERAIAWRAADSFVLREFSAWCCRTPVATAKISRKISGPYQDVLTWARHLGSAETFIDRMTGRGRPTPTCGPSSRRSEPACRKRARRTTTTPSGACSAGSKFLSLTSRRHVTSSR